MADFLLRLARQWVAGATAADALARTKVANARSLAGIINLLGEAVTDQRQITEAVEDYQFLLTRIRDDKLDSTISIKPTQLGLSVRKELYDAQVRQLVEQAHAFRNFVWIDMESSTYTQDTLDTYLDLRGSFENVGVAIQAYLKRTDADLERLVAQDGKVRLVKGAYRESPAIALKSRKETTVKYAQPMTTLFERAHHFTIATHDGTLIDKAVTLSADYKPSFEFGMLLGVRDALKAKLVTEGYRVAEYIPYGRNGLGTLSKLSG